MAERDKYSLVQSFFYEPSFCEHPPFQTLWLCGLILSLATLRLAHTSFCNVSSTVSKGKEWGGKNFFPSLANTILSLNLIFQLPGNTLLLERLKSEKQMSLRDYVSLKGKT